MSRLTRSTLIPNLCLAKILSGIDIAQFHSLLAGFGFDAGTSKNVQE
jgi:hypothetical protein